MHQKVSEQVAKQNFAELYKTYDRLKELWGTFADKARNSNQIEGVKNIEAPDDTSLRFSLGGNCYFIRFHHCTTQGYIEYGVISDAWIPSATERPLFHIPFNEGGYSGQDSLEEAGATMQLQALLLLYSTVKNAPSTPTLSVAFTELHPR